jgi:hypothetical protein
VALAKVVTAEPTTTTLDSARRVRPPWPASGVAIIPTTVTAPAALATHPHRSREPVRELFRNEFTR